MITRSQRITQIRCADSDIRIRKSRVRACSVVRCSGGVSVAGFIAPQPRISPRLICGQGIFEDWQRELARFQIVFVSVLVQCIKMCSRFSVVALHWGHFSRCSRFLIWCQYLPMRRELWVARNRKDCIGLLMSGFRMEDHIVESVSRFDVVFWRAFRISIMLFMVVFVCVVVLGSTSAACTSTCVAVSSFIPWMLKLSGTDISMSSGSSLLAPIFARWSACSFPCSPE